jgi:tetratricopeptide (TPR) repeat protein
MRNRSESLADLVLAGRDSAFRHATFVLAVCLAASPEDLQSLIVQVWPGDEGGAGEAVKELLATSFVEETEAGWRINVALAPLLARSFLGEDEPAFLHAHTVLADREREALRRLERHRLEREAPHRSGEIENSGNEIDGWFAQGRLAFYLVGVQADEAVNQFGLTFESAPRQQLNIARMWLSLLVLRQAQFLGDYARVVAFFQGFRAYVSNRRDVARDYFDTTISDSQEDLYKAIALHLYAMCAEEPEDRIDDLAESVELSERLGLTENGIMARNSLCSALLSRATSLAKAGQHAEATRDLQLALELAETNVQRSSGIQFKEYLAYTIGQRAIVQWAIVAGIGRASARGTDARNKYPSVLDELRQAVGIAESAGLSDSVLYYINRIAGVLRDVGKAGEALEELESAVPRVTSVADPVQVRRLGETARSLDKYLPRNLKPRLKRLLTALNRENNSTAGSTNYRG